MQCHIRRRLVKAVVYKSREAWGRAVREGLTRSRIYTRRQPLHRSAPKVNGPERLSTTGLFLF